MGVTPVVVEFLVTVGVADVAQVFGADGVVAGEVGCDGRKLPVGVGISDDHGENWTFIEIRTPAAITSVRNISCEARVSELPDGKLIYNMRSRNSGRQIAFSRDGGRNWSETVTAKELVAAQCNGSTITVRDCEGKLTQTMLCSLPRGKGRSNGVIYVSRDGGRSWPHHKLIIPAAFAYSALIQLDAETIGLFYETNHHRDIRFVTVSLDDLNPPTPSDDE